MKLPAYKLHVPDNLAELIRRMHPHLKKKVKSALQIILSDPETGKALKDELAGLRSFRVSRFRKTEGVWSTPFTNLISMKI